MGLPWHKRSAGRRGALRTDRMGATNRSVTNGGGSGSRRPDGSDFVCMSAWPMRASSVPVSGVSGGTALGDSTAVNASTIGELTVTRALDGLAGSAKALIDDAATEMFVSATASTIATPGISWVGR